MNAADQISFLRDLVAEATAAHWSDLNLLRRLNMAQEKVAKKVAMTPGQWLVTSGSVTPSASVITLPSDCGKPIYLEETANGRPIRWLGDVRFRRVSRTTGTSLDTTGYREAYPLMATLEVNQDSYNEACTLWYEIRVPKLHYGYANAGAANSITFDKSTTAATNDAGTGRELVYLADYYNNATIEVIDGTSGIVDIRSTISDYTAAGVATITGTAAANDIYGTVSRLPEETHMLMVLEAAVLALMKPNAQFDVTVYRHLRDELRDTRKEIYNWLETRTPGGGGVQIGDAF